MEVQRAHFSLGTENSKLLLSYQIFKSVSIEMPKRSYGQDLIEKSIEMQQSKSKNQEAEAKERKKMVENSRKSNFNIGETAKIKAGGYAIDTSSNVAYNSQLLKSYDNAHALKMKENQMDYK